MQTRDEYQRAASYYDLLLSRGLRSIRNNIRTCLRHYGAANVIDLCCGTGEQLRMMHDDRMLLTGVDLSGAMLAQALKTSPSSIHYLETDATRLPLPDNEYDGVIITLALHEKTARQQQLIFQEACRILKHDGHIIIADYSIVPERYDSALVGKIIIPLIERLAGLDHYHNYRDWMDQGALQGFLKKHCHGKLSLISPHSKGCIQLYAVSKVKDDPLATTLRQIQQQFSAQDNRGALQ